MGLKPSRPGCGLSIIHGANHLWKEEVIHIHDPIPGIRFDSGEHDSGAAKINVAFRTAKADSRKQDMSIPRREEELEFGLMRQEEFETE